MIQKSVTAREIRGGILGIVDCTIISENGCGTEARILEMERATCFQRIAAQCTCTVPRIILFALCG